MSDKKEVIHVLPVDDISEHFQQLDCPCHPIIEEYEYGIVVIHNAYDFRDVAEWLNEEHERCV